MDAAVVISLVGLSALQLINIILLAYGYGRLTQKVDDFCGRVDRLERINDKGVLHHAGSE